PCRDDMSTYLAGHAARTETQGYRGSRRVGNLGETTAITGLDLIPHRCALAISHGDGSRVWRCALPRDGFDRHRLESRVPKLNFQSRCIVVTMRRASQEHRWIVRKQVRGGFHHDVGEFVFFNPVPDA